VAEVDNAGGVNIQANSPPVIVTWGGAAPAAPAVSGVSPAAGPASGGTPVTITGSGFAAGDTVAFGNSAASGVTVASATSMTATSPAGSGAVDVRVTGPGGASAAGSADRFTYAAPPAAPAVSGVSPASGPGSGGTPVAITGSGFAAGDTVAFGGSAASGVTVNSATSITADAPAGNSQLAGGTVDVTVTGPGGASAVSPADEFTYLVSSGTYSISLAASTTAPAVGGSVTLTATANKDIGPTPYGMSIVDASSGAIVSHVGSGSSFSVTVSQSAAVTQRYVAEVDNAGGVNIQANSPPVIVTWGGTQ